MAFGSITSCFSVERNFSFSIANTTFVTIFSHNMVSSNDRIDHWPYKSNPGIFLAQRNIESYKLYPIVSQSYHYKVWNFINHRLIRNVLVLQYRIIITLDIVKCSKKFIRTKNRLKSMKY